MSPIEWNDADFTGVIKVYDLEPKASVEPYDMWDDYDERLKGESQWKSYEM